jgi:hypothetical protein
MIPRYSQPRMATNIILFSRRYKKLVRKILAGISRPLWPGGKSTYIVKTHP